MSSKILQKKLIAGTPLIASIFDKLKLELILQKFILEKNNEKISTVQTLLLIICNITLGRQPLYELEHWANNIELNYFGLDNEMSNSLNDDRFGRALDKLYHADRASLMTAIVIEMVKTFNLNLSRIHNDSTTLKAYGKIPGTTKYGLTLKKGKSKDHRPDLKQLLFTLSISADRAVPIHFKTYSGNRTDDTTHIETWNTLCQITNEKNFIYVADCKVCTSKQLFYIVDNGGRVITILPKTWNEYKNFLNMRRIKKIEKKRIWRRLIPNQKYEYETFSIFIGNYSTEKNGYKLYWIYSSEKAKDDLLKREVKIGKAHQELLNILQKLNKRNFKTKSKIKKAVEGILKKYDVENFIDYKLTKWVEKNRKKIGKGRPGPNAKYIDEIKVIYKLSWEINKMALKIEKRVDGIFPLLSTDINLSGKDVLKHYKYQPRLEKRFNQLKSVHNAAPLFFKKIQRVEAIMFLFFIAVMVQSLIEREVRTKMQEQQIKSIQIYPENRDAFHPTTSKILYIFENICAYKIMQNGQIIEEYKDKLTNVQNLILGFLNINMSKYWCK